MKSDDKAVNITARRMVVCVVAAFALPVHACAMGCDQVKAYDAMSIRDAQLRELAQKCNGLALRYLKESGSIKRPLILPCTSVVDAFRKEAERYIGEYRLLRTQVEGAVVPAEEQNIKNSLLGSIDEELRGLNEVREMQVEDMANISIRYQCIDRDRDNHERMWCPLAVSFVPAIELPGRDADIYGIRLNLLGGEHHGVAGIDAGGIFNTAKGYLFGVQVAGLINGSASRVMGMQIAGYSCTAGVVYGVQGAAGGNFVSGIDGIQILGCLNHASRMRGCQISAGQNYTIVGMGVQLSVQVNHAEKFSGVQCGVINLGGEIKGCQVGVYNFANTMTGCQIGLCNVIKSSPVPVLPVFNMYF